MTALHSTTADQRFILRDADWQTYQGLREALGDRPIRVTYDRGRLELMTLSFGHESYSRLLGRLVEILTEELERPMRYAGSTTVSRQDLDRGLEPDHCFYLENEELVRDKDEIDLRIDPPPDLAIEVEISRSSLNRLAIYAAIRVPEVWRFDGTDLTAYLLKGNDYERSATSGAFPFLAVQGLLPFLKMRTAKDDNAVVRRSFRAWVRERIAADWR